MVAEAEAAAGLEVAPLAAIARSMSTKFVKLFELVHTSSEGAELLAASNQLEVREARRRNVEAAPRGRIDAGAARTEPLVGAKELELLGRAPRLGEVSGHRERHELVLEIAERLPMDEEPGQPRLDAQLVPWPRARLLEAPVALRLPACDGHELAHDTERRPRLGLERGPLRVQRREEKGMLPREVSDGGRRGQGTRQRRDQTSAASLRDATRSSRRRGAGFGRRSGQVPARCRPGNGTGPGPVEAGPGRFGLPYKLQP